MEKTQDDLFQTIAGLRSQISELEERAEAAEEALRAIQSGEVDALVINDRVYTLENADKTYRVMVEKVQEGVATLQVDGMVLYANKRLAEMLGLPLEQLQGSNLRSLVATSDQRNFDGLLQRGKRGASKGELALMQPDGSTIPVLLSMTGIENQDLQVLVLVASDLSTQKGQEEIVASERLSRSILDQASEAIIVCDPQGTVIRASQAAVDLLTTNPLYKPFNEIYHLSFIDSGEAFPLAAVLQGNSYHGIEARLEQGQSPTGKFNERILLLSAAPLCNEAGQILGCTLAFIDITDRILAEEETRDQAVQIELQHRLLEQREQERQRIARDLHDGPIQELVAAIFSVQTLISDNQDDQTIKQYETLKAVLSQVIVGLRAFAGELRPPSLMTFGLSKAILSYASDYHEQHPDLQIDVETVDEDHLSPEMRLGIFRIFQESLNNVNKHAQATKVRILLEVTPEDMVLQIIDNGAGFNVSKDWLELARAGHLGLVGMRERAEAIGGKLEIESTPGRGTGIQVIVPLPVKP